MELISENIFLIRNEYKFASNTYILKDRSGLDCILIDPGLDQELIIQAIQKTKVNPIAIISTHGHFDHIGSVAWFQSNFKIPFYLHEKDLKLSQSANFFMKLMGINYQIETPFPDFLIKDDLSFLQFGSIKLQVEHAPGHSPGSCLFVYNDFLFSGDILFKNGLGQGTIPKEDKKNLRKSIKMIFSKFSGSNWLLPGHGDKETLENIKRNNIPLNLFLQNGHDAE